MRIWLEALTAKRMAAMATTLMAIVASIIYLFDDKAHPTEMLFAYILSAFFWFAASIRAEIAPPGGAVGSSNLLNAIAASLAAAGATASIDHGWDRIFHPSHVASTPASDCNCSD